MSVRISLPYLRALEAESIYIIREVAAEFSRPVMLYSIGKDSSVMLRLAQKAFFPARIPFPLLHVDTTYKFHEMTGFRRSLLRKNRRATDRAYSEGSAGGNESLRPRHAKVLCHAQDQVVTRCTGGRSI